MAPDSNPRIEILRLGHRLPRDERISTHVALVSRAFGASAITYSGQHDAGLEDSVRRICDAWGGKTGASSEFSFSISYEKSFIKHIKQKKADGFSVVHLTMYGMPLMQKIGAIRKCDKVLIVVGSEQVPRDVYDLADFNISITNQPHSEVAALAITLDRITGGAAVAVGQQIDYGGKISIVPSEKGKNVKKKE